MRKSSERIPSARAAILATSKRRKAPLQQQRVTAKRIEIKGATGNFDGYLTEPGSGSGAGVILVSTIFGVDQNMKEMSEELAERGCVALVPNFFWRDEDPGLLRLPEDIERAVARVHRVDFSTSMDDLRDAIEELRLHPRCNGRFVILGFCFGGPLAWRAACDGLGVNAALSFHGSFVSKAMKPGDNPSCPVSFFYGDSDEYAPDQELQAVEAVAKATGSEFVVFPGVGHAFMIRADLHHYNEGAASKSWQRTLQIIDTLQD